MTSCRRNFILGGVSLAGLAATARAATPAVPVHLEESRLQGKALGYVNDLGEERMNHRVLTLNDRSFSCLVALNPGTPGAEDLPLIVALHGGTYTSRYFDISGYSLLDRAEALGVPIIAIDRPGYGQTPILETGDVSHAGNAAILDAALADLWEQEGERRAGIALIGHSIGGAIALRIAARRPRWPLLGIAVSGVGLKNAPNGPSAMKDRNMFGPAGTFSVTAPDASRAADAPAPRQELIDITSTWPREVATVLAGIEVPVHYRQAAQDKLWIVSREEVRDFATACSAAPRVDARLVENAGHCIDFHRAGASFQLEQLAFALGCAFDHNFK